MEFSLPKVEFLIVKEPVVYHVEPDKTLDRWAVVREGKKSPRARNLSKTEALQLAGKIARKKARRALVLVHKTRYIIEGHLRFS